MDRKGLEIELGVSWVMFYERYWILFLPVRFALSKRLKHFNADRVASTSDVEKISWGDGLLLDPLM